MALTARGLSLIAMGKQALPVTPKNPCYYLLCFADYWIYNFRQTSATAFMFFCKFR